ncbi:Smr/MutS family protein [Alkalibaculum bacchi]|uniref:Smr/MutS family protein n=1 Tax=Alkalibaculum bacchi TaxID=645887 RepID=UPI0026F12B2F|nr:Smr/MutS family protein [Alkalibaculum bacchi]
MDNSLEVDLHGMTVMEARSFLQKVFKNLSINITEVVVIHGNNRGDKLANMVRKDFKHKRIDRKILSLNGGITILRLKMDC